MIDPVMGQKVALHATATGKVWLASLTTETALRYVLRDGFGTPEDHGPFVVQTIEDLQAELIATRKRGYGLAIEEADPGIAAIAIGIPASGSGAGIVGTVSIAGPHSRLQKEKLIGMLPSLQEAVRRLHGIEVLMEFVEA
jgi:DNA-binding IclR family transcriptional regulator